MNHQILKHSCTLIQIYVNNALSQHIFRGNLQNLCYNNTKFKNGKVLECVVMLASLSYAGDRLKKCEKERGERYPGFTNNERTR